jgi:hypothetical protein
MTAEDSLPLLEIDASAVGASESSAAVGGALRTALARGGPFSVVIRMSGRPRRMSGAVERVRLMRELRPGLAERCRSLAFVMPVEVLRDNAEFVRSGGRVCACPTTATDNLDRARGWARERLVSGGGA